MTQMIFVADTSNDNVPVGIMMIDTPDFEATIKEIFDNEPDCEFVRYAFADEDWCGKTNLFDGMMLNWDALETVYRDEE